MAAMAGILFFKMRMVVFLVSVIPSRYHGGQKKSMFVRHFKKWNAPQIFIYFSHDTSPQMTHYIPWKIIIIIKKDRCRSWCVVKFSTMSYVGNQAHTQLCIVWACIEEKFPQPLGFTLHNKIHKWMINSKRTQTKHPNFTPSKPPQMKKWIWQQQWRRNYKNKIKFSSVTPKTRL